MFIYCTQILCIYRWSVKLTEVGCYQDENSNSGCRYVICTHFKTGLLGFPICTLHTCTQALINACGSTLFFFQRSAVLTVCLFIYSCFLWCCATGFHIAMTSVVSAASLLLVWWWVNKLFSYYIVLIFEIQPDFKCIWNCVLGVFSDVSLDKFWNQYFIWKYTNH